MKWCCFFKEIIWKCFCIFCIKYLNLFLKTKFSFLRPLGYDQHQACARYRCRAMTARNSGQINFQKLKKYKISILNTNFLFKCSCLRKSPIQKNRLFHIDFSCWFSAHIKLSNLANFWTLPHWLAGVRREWMGLIWALFQIFTFFY